MAEVPSIASLIFNLQRCRTLKNLDYAKHLHAFACNNGLDSHSVVGNHLVPLFVDCESVFEAQKVFNRLIDKNEHSWTSLIHGHVQYGKPKLALNLYEEMQEHGVDSSSFTLVALLKAFSQLKDIDCGREIHSQIAHKGFDREDSVGSMLVNLYAKCGSLYEAVDVFEGLSLHRLSTWNSLIHGYVEHGNEKDAWSSFEMMQKNGISPDSFTFSCVLKACSNAGALIKGQNLHKEIIGKSLEVDLSVGNTLISMYARGGLFLEAEYLFHTMGVRDVVTWTAMIGGFSDHGFTEEALKHYDEMHFEGIYPNSVTVICVLKACCANKNAIEKGRELHSELIGIGLERENVASNTLLAMYAKCGSWLDARYVLEKLTAKDTVAWTALTVGYVEHCHFHEVLTSFEEMRLINAFIDTTLFSCILKACASLKALENGLALHMDIICKGLETDLSVGNSLISMYARCGFFPDAEKVLSRSKSQDIVSWTSIVSGYVENGCDKDALKCIELMKVEGMTPEPNLYACALKACIGIADISIGHELHRDIVACGYEKHGQIGNTLIDFYSKLGLVCETQQLFNNLLIKDIVSWTVLITGYAERELNEEVLKWFSHMQIDGVAANAFILACVLKSCGHLENLEKGQELHSLVIQDGLETDPLIGSSIIDMYTRCGFLSKAKQVFDMLPVHEVVSWTALISAYLDTGHAQEALNSFERMLMSGESADVVTLSCCLRACTSTAARGKGQNIHIEIAKKGFDGDIPIINNLVCLYSECGLVIDAHRVFDKMPTHNIVGWTSLIARYAEHGTGQKALDLYEKMTLECVIPHSDTYACILKACGCVGAMRTGQEIHQEVIQRGMEEDLSVGNSLINMYAKCGSTQDAHGVFESLPDRDVVAWSSIIAGYGLNHQGKMAIQCFEAMQEHGIKPDAVSFTCLLNACRHVSLANRGKEYFREMNEVFSIEQTVEHYICMIDFLARLGQLNEAERLLGLLPPSERTWAVLLNACRTYGDPELGLRCFEMLIAMKPEDAAWYVLMAEIYSNSGRMDDAYRIEEMRKSRGIKKKAASALIEVDKKVHEFVVGSTENQKISSLIDFFSFRLQGEGHVPNLDLVPRDLTDVRKKSLLCIHAEKLAIAFGLLNTPQGETLRVTKNLRMCSNCHDATKIISRIEKREIILRDNCCIHHFRNGSCSCLDMF